MPSYYLDPFSRISAFHFADAFVALAFYNKPDFTQSTQAKYTTAGEAIALVPANRAPVSYGAGTGLAHPNYAQSKNVKAFLGNALNEFLVDVHYIYKEVDIGNIILNGFKQLGIAANGRKGWVYDADGVRFLQVGETEIVFTTTSVGFGDIPAQVAGEAGDSTFITGPRTRGGHGAGYHLTDTVSEWNFALGGTYSNYAAAIGAVQDIFDTVYGPGDTWLDVVEHGNPELRRIDLLHKSGHHLDMFGNVYVPGSDHTISAFDFITNAGEESFVAQLNAEGAEFAAVLQAHATKPLYFAIYGYTTSQTEPPVGTATGATRMLIKAINSKIINGNAGPAVGALETIFDHVIPVTWTNPNDVVQDWEPDVPCHVSYDSVFGFDAWITNRNKKIVAEVLATGSAHTGYTSYVYNLYVDGDVVFTTADSSNEGPIILLDYADNSTGLRMVLRTVEGIVLYREGTLANLGAVGFTYAFTYDGRYLLVFDNAGTGTVSVYDVDAGSTVSSRTGVKRATGMPWMVDFDSKRKFYGREGLTTWSYLIGADGSITPQAAIRTPPSTVTVDGVEFDRSSTSSILPLSMIPERVHSYVEKGNVGVVIGVLNQGA